MCAHLPGYPRTAHPSNPHLPTAPPSPSPIVVHKEVSKRNRDLMEELQGTLMKKCNMEVPKHIKPSDEAEIKVFFGLTKHES